MRLEFIDDVKEGEILGKNILDDNDNILLRAGTILTQNYVQRLKRLGVNSLYIRDDRMADVCIVDEGLEKIKRDARKSMKNIVLNIKNSYNIERTKVKEAEKVVEELVDTILDTKEIVDKLYDIKVHDEYTAVHSIETGVLSAFLANDIIRKNDLKDLTVGAILHDIGKTKVPAEIINKPGRLTEEEFEIIKKHPLYGVDIVRDIFGEHTVMIDAIRGHHERIDGLGYPYGLSGKKVKKEANIVSICDVYNAVSTKRSYRDEMKPSDAYELILAGSGTQFDEELVRHFKSVFYVYRLGTKVLLSNGEEGYVVAQNPNFPDRPKVRVFQVKENGAIREIDLVKETNIVIIKVLS